MSATLAPGTHAGHYPHSTVSGSFAALATVVVTAARARDDMMKRLTLALGCFLWRPPAAGRRNHVDALGSVRAVTNEPAPW